MLATGERRARLGDLAGGTMIVLDGGTARRARRRPWRPSRRDRGRRWPTTSRRARPVAEVAEAEPARVRAVASRPVDEPSRSWKPWSRVVEAEPVVERREPVEDEPVSAVPPATPWVVKDEPPPDLAVVETQPRDRARLGRAGRRAAAGRRRHARRRDPLAEGARRMTSRRPPDPSGAASRSRSSERRAADPLAEVEIGGPEIDVDEPRRDGPVRRDRLRDRPRHGRRRALRGPPGRGRAPRAAA